MKRIRNIGIVLLIAGIVGIMCLWVSIADARPWPKNSCAQQAIAILDQRPAAVVWYRMIVDPGQLGHGQWHVQPQDGDKWLTIDRYNRIHESDEPQYIFYPIKFTAEQYRERVETLCF